MSSVSLGFENLFRNSFVKIRIRAMILVATKSTIDSAYKPPAVNAAGRAAPRNKRADSVVTRGGASKEIPGVTPKLPVRRRGFG